MTPLFRQFPRNNHRWKAVIVRTLGKDIWLLIFIDVSIKAKSLFHSAESARDAVCFTQYATTKSYEKVIIRKPGRILFIPGALVFALHSAREATLLYNTYFWHHFTPSVWQSLVALYSHRPELGALKDQIWCAARTGRSPPFIIFCTCQNVVDCHSSHGVSDLEFCIECGEWWLIQLPLDDESQFNCFVWLKG